MFSLLQTKRVGLGEQGGTHRTMELVDVKTAVRNLIFPPSNSNRHPVFQRPRHPSDICKTTLPPPPPPLS